MQGLKGKPKSEEHKNKGKKNNTREQIIEFIISKFAVIH